MRTARAALRAGERVLGAVLAAALAATPPAAAAAERPAAGPVEVGTARGAPGQKARGRLKVLETSDGAPIAVPVVVVSGRDPGPVVWAHACSHGDEYGGPRALQDVVRGLDPARMSGTLVAVRPPSTIR
jgi:hypothetical protein